MIPEEDLEQDKTDLEEVMSDASAISLAAKHGKSFYKRAYASIVDKLTIVNIVYATNYTSILNLQVFC